MIETQKIPDERVKKLIEITLSFVHGNNAVDVYKEFSPNLNDITPTDVINAVILLEKTEIPKIKLKPAIHKMLNTLGTTLKNFPSIHPRAHSFLDYALKTNIEIEHKIQYIRPWLKEFNIQPNNEKVKSKLLALLFDLSSIEKYYIIKEKIIFPVIKENWPSQYFIILITDNHVDVKNSFRTLNHLLETDGIDLPTFNRSIGTIFHTINAIKFREENILYPLILNTIPEIQFDNYLNDALEIGFPFIHQNNNSFNRSIRNQWFENIDLGTGFVSTQVIAEILNNFPAETTFINADNNIQFFSNPKDRILERANNNLNRKISHCYPKHIAQSVENALDSIKSRKQSAISIDIEYKNRLIELNYKPVFDQLGNYIGSIETLQLNNKTITPTRLLKWEENDVNS